MDYGATSVISDPKTGESIALDHIAKEARVLPMPKLDQLPKAPSPPMPGTPAVGIPGAPVKVEDLGKAVIDGHPVEGKRFTFKLPAPPPLPEPPKPPVPPIPPQVKLPDVPLPAMPKPPAPPQVKPPDPPLPPPPEVPVVSEVWTSVPLKMPIFTQTTGAFGKQTCKCKCIQAEPPAKLFQIPPEYKVVVPPPPPQPPV